MRIFVSSGGSYVGRHIVQHLLINRGYQVMYSWAHGNPYPENEDCVKLDFLTVDPASIDRVVDFKPDVIIACTGAYTGEDSNLSIINISAAAVLAQIARRCAVETVIHLSSLSVYGWPLPIAVDTAQPKPSDHYGKSKYLQEIILSALQGFVGKIVNIRLPVVLGKGAHRAWLPRVRDMMVANLEVCYSNPRERYTAFTTISAVCNFLDQLIESHDSGCFSFPIGGNAELTVDQMLIKLRAQLKSCSKLTVSYSDIPMASVESNVAVSMGYVRPSIEDALREFLCQGK